jgi:hypothetical protein
LRRSLRLSRRRGSEGFGVDVDVDDLFFSSFTYFG